MQRSEEPVCPRVGSFLTVLVVQELGTEAWLKWDGRGPSQPRRAQKNDCPLGLASGFHFEGVTSRMASLVKGWLWDL